MSDDQASPNAPEPKPTAGQIEVARSRFETGWKSGQRPKIENFLQGESADELLAALVCIDLEYRWRPAVEPASKQPDGEMSDSLPARPRLEDYLAQLPDLGPLERLPLAVIVEEYHYGPGWYPPPRYVHRHHHPRRSGVTWGMSFNN